LTGGELVEAVIFVGLQGAGKSSFYRERFFDTHLRLSLDMLRTRHRERLLVHWTKLDTTWVCLDCELMPWSAKAKELLRTQHAAVGAAIHRSRRGLSRPAVKCRGREYLRIIYGPDYTSDENLGRLRSRGFGRKRTLALGEFALGVEGLERFVRGEPLRRIHECLRRAGPGERARRSEVVAGLTGTT
jgi:hypothetical protein